jgi:hypothetical protein
VTRTAPPAEVLGATGGWDSTPVVGSSLPLFPVARQNRLAIVALCISFVPQVVVSSILAVIAVVHIRRRREQGLMMALMALVISAAWLVILVILAFLVFWMWILAGTPGISFETSQRLAKYLGYLDAIL